MKSVLAFLILFVSLSQSVSWLACTNRNHLPYPPDGPPANYSNVCVDGNFTGECGPLGGPFDGIGRMSGCYDGDQCTLDICTFCDCSGNCTDQCQDEIFHCGCAFIPIDGCCNYDVECNDTDICTTDTCAFQTNNASAHECVFTPIPNCCVNVSDCGLANECNLASCDNNQCNYTAVPFCCTNDTHCNDGNNCTLDTCILGNNTCLHETITDCCLTNEACNDGNNCTLDTCVGNLCLNTTIVDCCLTNLECNDFNNCTTDTCIDNLCVYTNVTDCCLLDIQCNDGNNCTLDTCVNNLCQNNTISGCCLVDQDCPGDEDICTNEQCIENICVTIVNTTCCHVDSECDDTNPCTNDTCQSNACNHSVIQACCNTNQDCNDDKPCSLDTCTNNTCVYTVDPTFCLNIDQDICTNSYCDINNTHLQTRDVNGCFDQSLSEGTVCGSDTLCSFNFTCCGGECKSSSSLDCSDGDLCTHDSCDPVLGCVHSCIDFGTETHGNNSFVCPCCQDCDCLTNPQLDGFGSLFYPRPSCVIVTLSQTLNYSGTYPASNGNPDISFFHEEVGNKIRQCSCTPDTGCGSTTGEHVPPFLSESRFCAPLQTLPPTPQPTPAPTIIIGSRAPITPPPPPTAPPATIPVVRKRDIPTQLVASMLEPVVNIATLSQQYECFPRGVPIDYDYNTVLSITSGFVESRCNASVANSCIDGSFCALPGTYVFPLGGGPLTLLFSVCLPIRVPGDLCSSSYLHNQTVYLDIGSGGCFNSTCVSGTCQPNIPCSVPSFSTTPSVCPIKGSVCTILGFCKACEPDGFTFSGVVPCATLLNYTITYQPWGSPEDYSNELCCAGSRCNTFGYGFVSSPIDVYCTRCEDAYLDPLHSSYCETTLSDEECCGGTFCVSALDPASQTATHICKTCVQANSFCDGDNATLTGGLGHNYESTAVCCNQLQCLNNKCVKQCSCDKECDDSNPQTIDECNEQGLCCHTNNANSVLTTPFPTLAPSISASCVLCGDLGAVEDVSVYSSSTWAYSSYVFINRDGNAKIGLVDLNNFAQSAISSSFGSIQTGIALTNNISVDALALYTFYSSSCTSSFNYGSSWNNPVFTPPTLVEGTSTFTVPNIVFNAPLHMTHSNGSLFILKAIGNVTFENGAAIIVDNAPQPPCNIIWIINGNLRIFNVSNGLQGTFIVNGNILIDVVDQPFTYINGRLLTVNGGSITMLGNVTIASCTCHDCVDFGYSCLNNPTGCCSGYYCNTQKVCSCLNADVPSISSQVCNDQTKPCCDGLLCKNVSYFGIASPFDPVYKKTCSIPNCSDITVPGTNVGEPGFFTVFLSDFSIFVHVNQFCNITADCPVNQTCVYGGCMLSAAVFDCTLSFPETENACVSPLGVYRPLLFNVCLYECTCPVPPTNAPIFPPLICSVGIPCSGFGLTDTCCHNFNYYCNQDPISPVCEQCSNTFGSCNTTADCCPGNKCDESGVCQQFINCLDFTLPGMDCSTDATCPRGQTCEPTNRLCVYTNLPGANRTCASLGFIDLGTTGYCTQPCSPPVFFPPTCINSACDGLTRVFTCNLTNPACSSQLEPLLSDDNVTSAPTTTPPTIQAETASNMTLYGLVLGLALLCCCGCVCVGFVWCCYTRAQKKPKKFATVSNTGAPLKTTTAKTSSRRKYRQLQD